MTWNTQFHILDGTLQSLYMSPVFFLNLNSFYSSLWQPVAVSSTACLWVEWKSIFLHRAKFTPFSFHWVIYSCCTTGPERKELISFPSNLKHLLQVTFSFPGSIILLLEISPAYKSYFSFSHLHDQELSSFSLSHTMVLIDNISEIIFHTCAHTQAHIRTQMHSQEQLFQAK